MGVLGAVVDTHLLRTLILKHQHHLLSRLMVATAHIELLLLHAVEEHLSLGVGVCHILSNFPTRSVVILKSLTRAATSAFLVCMYVGVTDELAHDSLLFAEVTRAAEHVAAVACDA